MVLGDDIVINTELFFLGNKVKHTTSVGEIRFLTIEEFLNVQGEIQLLVMNGLHMYYAFTKNIKEKSKRKAFWFLRDTDLFDIVTLTGEKGEFIFEEFFMSYVKIYELLFDSDTVLKIMTDKKTFHEIRDAFMKMQVLKEERVTKYAMTQKAFERRKKMIAEQMGDKAPRMADIASAIVVGTGVSYEEIANYTVYQLYLTYYRVSRFKEYDTTVLYSTVAPKVDVIAWAEHVDMYKEDTEGDLDAAKFMAKHGKK